MTFSIVGRSSDGTVAGLTAADPQRHTRQLGVVAPTGPGATYTGGERHGRAGGIAGDGHAVPGTILVGGAVVEAMERWAGVENYEERLVARAIDPLVLDRLRDGPAPREAG